MEEPKSLIPFTPVPVRARCDGWTVEKQYAFIEALAETGIVEEACRRVGMSRTSADNLRRRPCGVHFRRAWQTAVDYLAHLVEESAHRRSREGVARPIFHKGEQVGEWRHFDERLTIYMLSRHDRRPAHRLGPQPPSSGDEDYEEDPATVLDSEIGEIAECAPDRDGNPPSDWFEGQ